MNLFLRIHTFITKICIYQNANYFMFNCFQNILSKVTSIHAIFDARELRKVLYYLPTSITKIITNYNNTQRLFNKYWNNLPNKLNYFKYYTTHYEENKSVLKKLPYNLKEIVIETNTIGFKDINNFTIKRNIKNVFKF
jgi:hypothetical protein